MERGEVIDRRRRRVVGVPDIGTEPSDAIVETDVRALGRAKFHPRTVEIFAFDTKLDGDVFDVLCALVNRKLEAVADRRGHVGHGGVSQAGSGGDRLCNPNAECTASTRG